VEGRDVLLIVKGWNWVANRPIALPPDDMNEYGVMNETVSL
jgi:hypothetical protein